MSEAPEVVTLKVAENLVTHWSDLEIQFWLDSHPTVGFVAPFEPERQKFRETFRPFSYSPVTLTIEKGGPVSFGRAGELAFTGMLVDVVPRAAADMRLVDVTAYSLPALLADTDIPPPEKDAEGNVTPWQVSGLDLRKIAENVCAPFGIEVVFEQSPGNAFEQVRPGKRSRLKQTRVSGGAGQETVTMEGRVQDFLAELARQRGFVLSSTADGKLLFRRSVTSGTPVAKLIEGQQPVLTVEPTFNPQEYYSEIHGLYPAKVGRAGGSWREDNPFPIAARRVLTLRLDDTQAGEAKTAVQAALGRMFANMVSYAVRVPTWRNPAGELWAPNQLVELTAPSAMVYRATTLLVRGVVLYQNASEFGAELNLVLPGAFSGGAPGQLPWVE